MNRIIRLSYHKVINALNTNSWDKLVFNDTYQEFKLQSQYYNRQGKYHTFSQLQQHVPAAHKLHFLVSAAAIGYLKKLDDKIPDVLDNLGKPFLSFKNFEFKIIESDTINIANHEIAIDFFSEPLWWHDTVGDYLLVSEKKACENETMLTNVFQLRPNLSIYSLNLLENDQANTRKNIPFAAKGL